MNRILLLALLLICSNAHAGIQAGVGVASINPLVAGLKTQLGGYGERLGEPAHGTHDTIKAKALLLENETGERSAIISVDLCSVPLNLLVESLEAAAIPGLTADRVLMPASHSHGGTEGFSMDRRNTFANPRVGVFDEKVLDFTVGRIAEALKQAAANMTEVTVGSGSVMLPGFTANRRDDEYTDDELVLLRLDKADGEPLAVVVNFTAHGTFMTEKEMLVSGDWAGNMQRTVEALVPGATCLYMNGAEGDIRPGKGAGGSRYEMAEDYGRQVGIAAARLAEQVKTGSLPQFEMATTTVQLPARVPSPDFLQIAGAEYGVTADMLGAMLQPLFADECRLYSLRLGDWQAISIPGEAICQYGLAIKKALEEKGIPQGCVSGLTSEYIGYILTEEEYAQSGYEATASFYGPGLGALLLQGAMQLATAK